MQKVEIYKNYIDAKYEMDRHLKEGWRIHTCSIGSYQVGYTSTDHIIVVYER